ncbi:hypothetical protein TEA_027280 [Camellia sinensis var. sinensis]|uniref:Uncharacterized protein n=1 Tax=Camellia sinensis var. sinensis TaxID=542762 RepID=A0A4S4D474_CAMSN|nr:hypothetical protein TEA_027280 [Camellia sinensis var. sinensis]
MMGMEKLIVILKISSVWCLLLGCEIIIVEAAPKASRIKSLPGFNGTFPSKHYSGYVTINGDIAPSKNLFYYFVVSERNPRDDPVVLWLNGGPGCSSFDGFVYEHGLIAGEKPIINLKGYIVGNGVADEIFDGNGLVPFAHGMALIPDEMYEEAMTSCKGNYYNPPNNKCEIAVEKVNVAIDGLNLYDILEPCYHRPTTTSEDANGNKNTTSSTIPLSFKQLGVTEKPLAVRKRIYGRAWPFRAPVKVGVIPMWPELMKSAGIDVPCTDDTVATAWLNNDAVRKAIHVNQVRPDLDVINMHAWDGICMHGMGSGSWSLCTNDLLYNGDAGSIIPYHKNLTAQGYRALIYRYQLSLSLIHR